MQLIWRKDTKKMGNSIHHELFLFLFYVFIGTTNYLSGKSKTAMAGEAAINNATNIWNFRKNIVSLQ